jgi:hypothetical protein
LLSSSRPSQAAKNKYIVCVPAKGSLPLTSSIPASQVLTAEFISTHILRPSPFSKSNTNNHHNSNNSDEQDSSSVTEYITANAKSVTVKEGKSLLCSKGFPKPRTVVLFSLLLLLAAASVSPSHSYSLPFSFLLLCALSFYSH